MEGVVECLNVTSTGDGVEFNHHSHLSYSCFVNWQNVCARKKVRMGAHCFCQPPGPGQSSIQSVWALHSVVLFSCDHWHKQVTLLECLVFNACLIVPSVFGLVIPFNGHSSVSVML